MADGRQDDGSWSRAFMASSGIPARTPGMRREYPERHEAAGASLASARFAELAHHRDPEVREALARRDDCPLAVMASLAHDARSAVRVAVAANAAANAAVLESLGRDRDPAVLKAVARNPSTPRPVLAVLATHRRAEVRQVARRCLDSRAADAAQDGAESGAVPRELRDRGALPTGSAPTTLPATRLASGTYAPRPSIGRAPDRPRWDGPPTASA